MATGPYPNPRNKLPSKPPTLPAPAPREWITIKINDLGADQDQRPSQATTAPPGAAGSAHQADH
jgi:hypothetical protein